MNVEMCYRCDADTFEQSTVGGLCIKCVYKDYLEENELREKTEDKLVEAEQKLKRVEGERDTLEANALKRIEQLEQSINEARSHS